MLLEDDEAWHILPDFDIKCHGFLEGNKTQATLADTNCPCKPKLSFINEKPLVTHNSFIDMEAIEKSMSTML